MSNRRIISANSGAQQSRDTNLNTGNNFTRIKIPSYNKQPIADGAGYIYYNSRLKKYFVSRGAGANAWSPIGSGDVVSPGTSTDNAIARFNGTSGTSIENSGVLIDDSNNITGVGNINVNGELRLLDFDNSDNVSIKASTITTTYTLVMPPTQAIGGQVLRNDGTGNLSWVSVAGAQLLSSVLAIGNTTGGNNIVISNASDTIDFIRTNILTFNVATQSIGSATTTIPDLGGVSGDIVIINTAQTLTNKTITATNNNVAAKSLHSATTIVDVSAATAPSSGQVLTATGGTTATWQDADIVGSEYQFVESAGESSTTAEYPGSITTKLTLTTPSIPAGTYRISWFYTWRFSSLSNDFVGLVDIDATTNILTHIQEPKDTSTTQRAVVSGFYTIILTAAVHSIVLSFARDGGGGTAFISNARLEIFRIS